MGETKDYIHASFANVRVLIFIDQEFKSMIACYSRRADTKYISQALVHSDLCWGKGKPFISNTLIVFVLSTHTLCTSVQGYKQQRGFIIAQAPMKSTCRDFWKMVYERECSVIVMLSDLVENGEVGGKWWLYNNDRPQCSHFHFTAGGMLPVLACWWHQGYGEIWGVQCVCSTGHKTEWLHAT